MRCSKQDNPEELDQFEELKCELIEAERIF